MPVWASNLGIDNLFNQPCPCCAMGCSRLRRCAETSRETSCKPPLDIDASHRQTITLVQREAREARYCCFVFASGFVSRLSTGGQRRIGRYVGM